MIPHEVLIRSEYTCGLHSTSSFRTKNTLHHNASPHIEGPAVVTDPVIHRYLIDSIALLVDWDVAVAAEDNQVLIFVVSIITDGTLGIFLDHQASLVGAQRVEPD